MLRWMGAICVFAGCCGCGFMMVARHRREEGQLRDLLRNISSMQHELSYRESTLTQALRMTTEETVGQVLFALADELDQAIYPDVSSCMKAVLEKFPSIMPKTNKILHTLGSSLGKFDLSGQLSELDAVKSECIQLLQAHCENRDGKLRNYQTIGICAGLVLAILLL